MLRYESDKRERENLLNVDHLETLRISLIPVNWLPISIQVKM